MTLIPTRTRSRTPRELAFPIGAEALSAALRDAPQFDQLSVDFGFYGDLAEIRADAAANRPVEVLAARYRNVKPGRSGSNYFIERGWYDETWELSVSPVLREHKSLARQLLIDDGLGRVLAWLAEPRTDGWRHGRHAFVVCVCPADRSIVTREA